MGTATIRSESSGNCPEYISWAAVCGEAGIYKTLRLSTLKDKSLKCCDKCDHLVEGAKRNLNIEIQDLFISSEWRVTDGGEPGRI